MSTNNHTQARKKSLHIRGIPANDKIIRNNTIITNDNKQILLEKSTLIQIANGISNKTNKSTDINNLITFVKNIDYTILYNKSYLDSINEIVYLYTVPNNIKPNLYINNLDIETPDVTDYLKRQALYMTDNENQYKFTSHAARRGDSIIYTDLQDKIKDNTRQIHDISDSDFKGKLLNGIQNLQDFFNPQNIDGLVKRAGSASPGLQTYQNITFPRRLIPLDSKNRLRSSTSSCMQWSLNYSGQQGQLGNIYVQDTIKQIIRLQLFPFWLPISNPLDIFYNKIRIYVKEFWDAGVSTEFLGSSQTDVVNEKYHFEFDIETITPTRIFLKPVQPFYNFNKPIARIETISMSFYNPFNEIIFDDMEGIFTVTNAVNTVFTSTINHNLTTGDLVYILNFNSTDTSVNIIINSIKGHIITVLNSTSFTIDVDTLLLLPVSDVEIIYGSKRIFFQMEFTSLEH